MPYIDIKTPSPGRDAVSPEQVSPGSIQQPPPKNKTATMENRSLGPGQAGNPEVSTPSSGKDMPMTDQQWLASCSAAGGTSGKDSSGRPTCTMAGTILTRYSDGTIKTSAAPKKETGGGKSLIIAAGVIGGLGLLRLLSK